MRLLLKKFVFIFLSFWLLAISNLTLIIPKAHAQSTWYNQSPAEWYMKVYDETTSPPNEIFGERYTAAQVQWIIYSIPSIIINWATGAAGGNANLGACLMGISTLTVDVGFCVEAMISATDNVRSLLKFDNSSGLNIQPKSIVAQILEDRPLSGITYFRNVARKVDFIPEARAADSGFGFGSFGPLSGLWRLTRNIAYFFFVIVAVVFAFMIMFRIKLNPQTVITIQSALPKIIIALILVTFSFAIAGLMVDLIYVIMGLFSVLMSSFLPSGLLQNINALGVFNFINGSIPVLRDSGIAILAYFVVYLLAFFIAAIVAFLASASGVHISSMLFSLVMVIFTVILFLILLWYIIKTVYVLFKNLAAVYGLVIIGPLQIMSGALFPQAGFGSWLKKLFSKLIVFPLTGIFIYLALYLLVFSMVMSLKGIVDANFFSQLWDRLGSLIFPLMGLGGIDNLSDIFIPGEPWGPPMLGNPASASAIAFLLMSVGLIMLIPKISDTIEAFMAGKSLGPTGIGEALGPFSSAGKFVGGTLQEGLGRYAGAPLIDRLLEAEAYKRFATSSGFGKEVNKFIGGLYDQLNRSRK